MRKFLSAVVVSGALLALASPAHAANYNTAQVAKHSTSTDCWTIVNKGVYNLTGWIKKHPGGSGPILGMCGKDGSRAFTSMHGGQSTPASYLARYKIGNLK